MPKKSGTPQRVLMCPPTYYKVPAIENVHMDVNDQPDSHLKWLQWMAPRNLAEMLGLKVFGMEPRPLLFSQTFTANGGWGRHNEVVLSNFLNPTRQGEKEYFREWLRRLGSTVFELPDGIFFEGQGDVQTTSAGYIIASGIRSSKEAQVYLERLLKLRKPLAPVNLVDQRFYHLDTCMMSLRAKNALLYYPGAFDQESQERIKSLPLETYAVSERLALLFVCNSVFVHNVILLNIPFASISKESFELSAGGQLLSKDDRRYRELIDKEPEYDDLISYLWSLGYDIIPVYTSEFRKSGAGVRCLILFLD